MVQAVPDILTRIVEHKRVELSRRIARRGFRASLAANPPAIIAEIKKASPSKGLLAPDFDPARIARTYAQGGAACLSVLTDERFFQGSLADLQAARNACSLPVLRKDFTIDEFHVIEAAAAGADAILLIAAILTTAELTRFRELAESFHMDALVEVHDESDLSKAIDSGAGIIGVNNRNLQDFSVTLDTSLRLAEKIPAVAFKISESGIHNATDIRTLVDAGYQAFLVGEHLMRSADPASAIRELLTP